MSGSGWIAVTLAVFSVLLLPALGILVRGAVKWTRTEDKLGDLVGDVRELITDKDRAHGEMLEQMRLDREATNTRLRYLEEFWIDRGRQGYRR